MAPSDSTPPDPFPDIELDPDIDLNEDIDLDLESELELDLAPAEPGKSPPEDPASTPASPPSGPSPAKTDRPSPPRTDTSDAIDIDNSLRKLQHAVKVGSFILLILITLTLIVIYNLFAFRSSKTGNSQDASQNSELENGAASKVVPLDITRHLPRMQEVIEKYLAANSVEDILPYCRDPERVAPLLKDYYSRTPFAPVGLLQFGIGGNIVLEDDADSGRSFAYLNFETSDYVSKTICLEILEDDFKIDWESAVGYSEMAWEDFQIQKPAQATLFRVIAMPADYYNYEFSDPSAWASFSLLDGKGGEELYGFVARDSANHRKIRQAFQKNSNVWLVVRLKYPENARSSRCVEIDEVIHDRWVLGLSVEQLPPIDLPSDPYIPTRIP
jgi:hypothetical protein